MYQVQLDTILLNDNVDSDTKMNIMRQLILRSEQTNKDSTKIAGLFTSILKEKQENADIAMLAAQYLLTKRWIKRQPLFCTKCLKLIRKIRRHACSC